MKKSSFVAMILGTVAGVLFSLGMCMALIPEWNSFKEGVIFGAVGIVFGIITIIVWRKMEKKAPIKICGRMLAIILLCIVGTLIFGTGLCFCMVWENIVVGTVTGLVGIIMLFAVIPITKGLK